MADQKLKMQAPRGTTSANIEGHAYDVPKDGKITVVNPLHVETLKRHGFTEILAKDDKEALETQIDAFGADDKDELVEFIEERGGDADNSMGLKKLKRLARDAAGLEE